MDRFLKVIGKAHGDLAGAMSRRKISPTVLEETKTQLQQALKDLEELINAVRPASTLL